MSQRSGIQLFSNQAPIRNELIHQCGVAFVVASFNQVDHLMGHNIFEALRGFLCEFKIQPNATCFNAAASPLRLHFLNRTLSDLNAQGSLPFFKEWWNLELAKKAPQ